MNMPSPTSNTSFREKSAWASLVSILIVFVPYFVHVGRLFAAHKLTAGSVIGAFLIATGAAIVIQIPIYAVIALRSRQEEKDERDQAIEFKSFRVAYGILTSSVFLAVGAIVLFLPWLDPVFLSQLFYFCFVIAEVTKYATQVFCYRRGS